MIDGHVVAVEDIEGTDALLARVARLRKEGRIRASAMRGALVKTPKSGQDLRFEGINRRHGRVVIGFRDVPVIDRGYARFEQFVVADFFEFGKRELRLFDPALRGKVLVSGLGRCQGRCRENGIDFGEQLAFHYFIAPRYLERFKHAGSLRANVYIA